MKQTLLHVLFIFCSLLFTTKSSFAQQPQTVIDFFLLLPDSVFTSIKELNFAEKDSFPVRERTKMIANFDAQKRTFTSQDPRFRIISENEKNRLLCCKSEEVNMDVKVWTLSTGESLIAVDGWFKNDWKEQTLKFYTYKDGKLTIAKPIADSFPVKLFFDSAYCQRQEVNPNYSIPITFVEFSKINDEIEVKIPPEIFEEEIVGKKGHPLTLLSMVRIKRPWLLLTLQNDKFEIVK